MAQQGPPFTTARKYYEWAWRPVIHLNRPHWKEALVRRNLTWLWNSRTQAEDAACENLRQWGANALPMIDQTILPHRSVKQGEAPHPRAFARIGLPVAVAQAVPGMLVPPPAVQALSGVQALHVVQPVPAITIEPPAVVHGLSAVQSSHVVQPVPAIEPPTAVHALSTVQPLHVVQPPPPTLFVNTTAFPYWPPPGEGEDDLPGDHDVKWFAKTPTPDQQGLSWHGVQQIGEGSAGRVALFVQVDQEGNIMDRVAIKDNCASSLLGWIDMFKWRDRLPMDIAIQERLRTQGTRPNIHEYRGYLLDMRKRKYQVYNEVCDYGHLGHTLGYYHMQWSARREDFERAESEGRYFNEPEPELVIPEAFLWHVFASLVDAINRLEKGADPPIDMGPGKDWRPIVHGDMHLGNIFVKPPLEDGDGVVVRPSPFEVAERLGNSDEELRNFQFADLGTAESPQYPIVCLADWDRAFFDLQKPATATQPADPYQDNPVQYRQTPFDDPFQQMLQQMYPPEIFPTYDDPDAKIDTKSDIWGIGQIMFNLILNLPSDMCRPFTRSATGEVTFLVSDEPYADDVLDTGLFTDQAPYEASRRYSRQLKDLVKLCLRYEQMDRPDIGELGRLVGKARDEEREHEAPGPLRVCIRGGLERCSVGKRWRAGEGL